MRLGVGLSFFDSANEIPRLLDPIYKHVYKIYAINGRYSNFISDHDYSIDDSVKILKTYPNVVIDDFMAYQPVKRTRYLHLAGEDKCDFLMVMDADEYIHKDYQDWDKFYKSLEKASKRHEQYQIFKMLAFMNPAWTKAHNAVRHKRWRKYVRLHRNPGEQRYCLDTHYWFSPAIATDEDLIKGTYPMWQAKHVIDGIRIDMDSLKRTPKFMEGRNNWAWNTICEEHRRVYFKSCDFHYGHKHPPTDGFWSYDRLGRPLKKIAEEDGTIVKEAP